MVDHAVAADERVDVVRLAATILKTQLKATPGGDLKYLDMVDEGHYDDQITCEVSQESASNDFSLHTSPTIGQK